MSRDLDDDDFDFSDGGHDAMEAMLEECVRWLLVDSDQGRFLHRLAQEGPARFPSLLDGERAVEAAAGVKRQASEQAVLEQRFFRSFGLAIWAATPLPGNRFKPHKLVLPGRNEPCVCGSLRKYKHCCAPLFQHLPQLDIDLLGGLVIVALPAARWPGLPDSGASPAMVMAAADLLNDDGRLADAVRLLEPWARQPPPWPASHSELLDLLADFYVEADKPHKRQQLAQAMIDKGSPEVKAMGWQRQAMLAADAGDVAGADAAFEQAQRLTPDAPRLALLEVTLLLGTDRVERATQRADFHIRRLGRMPPSDEVVHTLQAMQALLDGDLDGFDDDGDGSLQVDSRSPLGRLLVAVEHLPPPRLRLRFDGVSAQDLGALRPDAATAKALKRWRQVFPLSALGLAHSGASGDWDQVFDGDEKWSRCFLQLPELADSFEALDGVLTVLETLPAPLAARPMAVLNARASALWSLLRQRWPQAMCEWAHLDNRPALRLVVRQVMADGSLRADGCFEWLEALVRVINPHDNHGLRERLAAVYLRRGPAVDALALCERYPADFVGMQLLHARSLLALQRLAEARAVLQGALKGNVHLGAVLQARRKPRMPDVDHYQVGSREEALLAVSGQHDLWGGDKSVRAWLDQCLAPPAPADGMPAASLPLFPDEGDAAGG